jgi:hypothetical protein
LKAYVIHQPGDVSALQFQNVSTPSVKPGGFWVRVGLRLVLVAAVNRSALLQASPVIKLTTQTQRPPGKKFFIDAVQLG